MKNLYTCCLMLLICLACEDYVVHQEQHECLGEVWPSTAVQRFTFPITDTTQGYDIILLVTYQAYYPYQNLFVAYTLKDEKAQLLQQGLSEGTLFEPKTGKPLGEGWFLNKKYQLVVLPAYKFQQPGNYCVEFTQFMRTDNLPGIKAIGVQINKAMLVAQVIENQ